MLGRTSYPKDYVESTRARVARQLKIFDALAKGSKAGDVDSLEAAFCESMVLGLELAFVHRVRRAEGKDGNPLNEVRLLAASLLEHDGIMSEDSTIKYVAAKSVTGIAMGDKIALDRATLARLAEAFFTQIEAKYPEA